MLHGQQSPPPESLHQNLHLPYESLNPIIVTWNGTLKSKTKTKAVIKVLTAKLVNFFREWRNISDSGVDSYWNLQFLTTKVCCRQKTFSPTNKILEIPLQLVVSVEAYLYAKNLTCCFESLWQHLSTSTWNDWIKLLLPLTCYHMQKINFITQLILEAKLTHCLSSLWECSDIPDHTYLKQPNNICCFHGPLVL